MDDDVINEMMQSNHDWVVHHIKSDKHGDLKRKHFTLYPRSQRSIEIYCKKDDYVMSFWKEGFNSRLLFNAVFLPDGEDEPSEV